MPLWVHLSLMEECRGRVERALSGPAESRDATSKHAITCCAWRGAISDEGVRPETLAAWTSVFEIRKASTMWTIACERLGLIVRLHHERPLSAALAVPKDFAPVRRNRSILRRANRDVWSAWRCLPWDRKVRGGTSSAC